MKEYIQKIANKYKNQNQNLTLNVSIDGIPNSPLKFLETYYKQFLQYANIKKNMLEIELGYKDILKYVTDGKQKKEYEKKIKNALDKIKEINNLLSNLKNNITKFKFLGLKNLPNLIKNYNESKKMLIEILEVKEQGFYEKMPLCKNLELYFKKLKDKDSYLNRIKKSSFNNLRKNTLYLLNKEYIDLYPMNHKNIPYVEVTSGICHGIAIFFQILVAKKYKLNGVNCENIIKKNLDSTLKLHESQQHDEYNIIHNKSSNSIYSANFAKQITDEICNVIKNYKNNFGFILKLRRNDKFQIGHHIGISYNDGKYYIIDANIGVICTNNLKTFHSCINKLLHNMGYSSFFAKYNVYTPKILQDEFSFKNVHLKNQNNGLEKQNYYFNMFKDSCNSIATLTNSIINTPDNEPKKNIKPNNIRFNF